MDNRSNTSSTVIGSVHDGHNEEYAQKAVVESQGEHKAVQETQSNLNSTTHEPIHSNQSDHDAPVADNAVVEPSAEEQRRAADQIPEELQLEHTLSPTTINAPDGLPRVQGKHFIPKPILFYVSVAVIVVDLFVMPIVYYYSFYYGTSLSLQDNFAVITGLFGLFCFLHYTYRGYKLLLHKKDRKKCRPLGWTRMGIMEFLHINIAIVIFLVEVELVAGTAPNDPLTRLVAMCPATINYYCGFLAIITQILADTKQRLPFNQSSTPKGSIWRPALLVFCEDFGAIECSGERDYRAAILARYDASPDFRKMIQKLSWFWGIGLIISGVVGTVLMFVLEEHIAFGVGWGVPPVFIAPLAIITNFWVKWETARERRKWAEKHSAGNGISVEG